MAENGKAQDEQRGPTRRVVLKRERVIALPNEITKEQQKAVATALGLKVTQVPVSEAWAVCGIFEGHSKTKAIEAHAGKPGTADAKAGAYKAPSVSAWSGGEEYVAPPRPLFERRALEDVVTP